MKRLSILGSTGSIGTSTLDVVERHPDRFSVTGLAEGHDVELLARQIERHRPRLVSVRDVSSLAKLKGLLGARMPEAVCGIGGACEVAGMNETDLVVSAIVGSAGLKPTSEAIKAGKQVALANKESLVVAGGLIMGLCRKHGVKLLPIDSEHSAIFQSLEGHRREDARRLILTASGGPFLKASASEIENAAPEQALKHPRWQMGAKITIDSASLMNKGLEVIEARWLFDILREKINVVIHPQSIVHSMVEFVDGCVMAELGVPDMRAPIAYALSYPERVESGAKPLDLAKIGALTFEEPDFKRFPCLRLAFEAVDAGRSMPAVLNAANEVAVDAFLKGRMKFGKIPVVIEKTMHAVETRDCETIDEFIDVDRWARERARAFI